MTSPVMSALVNARMREISNVDHAVEAVVVELLGSPPKYDDSSPVDFIQWSDGKKLPWRPASPASVALYVFERGSRGIDELMAEIGKISASHCSRGMSDPTTSWWASSALCAIAKIERPRSWPKDREGEWQLVPYSLKTYIVKRESERDTAVRKAQNEAADARKKLLALQSVMQGKSEQMEEEAR